MALPVNISPEISYKTARSGGKGGQNVNKVETMVEGSFDVLNSSILNEEQKKLVALKLKNRINAEGRLQVRSQAHRSQLSNKIDVTRRMVELVQAALVKEKPRLATKPSAASKTRRLDSKKRASEHKQNRQRVKYD